MRSRYLVVTLVFNGVFAVILALLAACSAPANIATQVDTRPDVRDVPVEDVASQVDAGARVSATTEPVASQATPMQDGLALLKSHCSGCHVIAWFDQIEKPRAEWEKVIDKMEAMGVRLSDTEKDILVDYLAVADKR
jgi:hypothetical protein